MARILAEELYEFTEPGTMLFQAAELMGFERKESRFQSRKKGRTEDQNCDDDQQNGQSNACYHLSWHEPSGP